MTARPALALLAALFTAPAAVVAFAQRPVCLTTQAQCPASAQSPGAPCRCPGSPQVWGTVIFSGPAARPDTAAPEQVRRRPVLRNDDLDDDGDVLAGPRHRHRPRPEPDTDE